MIDKPPPKYQVGDYVLVDEIYVIEDTLRIIRHDNPLSAVVRENRGYSSLGYTYVLDINFGAAPKPDNLANVCYWEDHIIAKIENPEETFWKVWGDR